MKGLFLKDILNLRQQAKIMLLVIGVWIVIGITGDNASFIGGAMMILAFIAPINAIAYDESAKWDRYALTMPISRRNLVLSKYLLSFMFSVAGALLSMLVNVLMDVHFLESLQTSAMLACAGMIFASLILPVLFRFGVEKGRLIMMALVMLPTLLIMLLPNLELPASNTQLLQSLAILIPVFTLVLAAASIGLSLRIYRRKEF